MADALPLELEQLLRADATNRERAWDTFVLKYHRLLLHTARSVNRDHDAAMDAYAHTLEVLRQDDFRRLRTYAPMAGCKFSTWLVMVARRLCVDQVRRRYGQPRGARQDDSNVMRARLADLVGIPVHDLLPANEDANPEVQLRTRQLSEAVASAVAELEPRDQLLVSLRFQDGQSARQIAALMGFATQFHVYRRLTLVLETLKSSLHRRGVRGPAA